MISTTSPRIVFVGEHTNWTSKWMYFNDDSNSSYSRNEFSDYKSESHKDSKDSERFARFIDTSDFVVRFSKLRTLSGSSKQRFTYGKKTDAIVVEGKVLDRNSHEQIYKKAFGEKPVLESISKYETNPFHLGYEDENFSLEIMKGVVPIVNYKSAEEYSYRLDNYGLPSKMSKETKQLYDRISSRIIASAYNPEVWFPLGRVVTKISQLMFNCICGMETPTFSKNKIQNSKEKIKSNLKRLEKNIQIAKSKYSEHMGLNGKSLDLNSFLFLRDLIDSYYESFEDLDKRFDGKLWWRDMLIKGKERLKSYGEEHVRKSPYKSLNPSKFSYHDAFEISRSAMHINRGTEALWMAMNDSRFQDYDFYVIGYYGLNQQFITPYLGDYLTEYQMLSDWIKSGKIKYLPEHIDEINLEYEDNLLNNKYPIFKQ